MEFKNATRIQDSVTSVLERRALLWLAAHLPLWVSSDQLTFLGFVAMLLAGCGYFLAYWHPVGLLLATLFLGLNWFGDSLDGTLARVRNRQRPRYGFYVDHMIDSFGALFLMAGLGLSGYVDWRIAMGMLIAFLLLSIETYLSSYTLGVFRLSFAKLGPTEIRILLSLGNVVLWLHPNMRVPGLDWRLFDFAGLAAISIMGIMLVTAALWHTAELYRQETHAMKAAGAATIILQWMEDAHESWVRTAHPFLTGGSDHYPSVFFKNAIVRAQASAASLGL